MAQTGLRRHQRVPKKSDGGGSTATTLFRMEHRWRRWRGGRLGRARVENAPAKLRTATSQFDKCLISFEYPLVSAQKRDPYGCRSAYSAELNVPGRSKTGRYIPRQR